jgi:hypothetical protein
MPFPTGLRALANSSLLNSSVSEAPGFQNKDAALEWAWAMNAGSSVLGSVLAMVIAIEFGLNATLACGAVAYILALALTGTLQMSVG